ncbi:unnamed protein product [Amoebophrya sp. A120]|nr:unnamed protein product [Amoebophrya sp. A120]|eukprot:GSA120T00021413001.1
MQHVRPLSRFSCHPRPRAAKLLSRDQHYRSAGSRTRFLYDDLTPGGRAEQRSFATASASSTSAVEPSFLDRHAEMQHANRSMLRPYQHLRLHSGDSFGAVGPAGVATSSAGAAAATSVSLQNNPWLPSSETMPKSVPLAMPKLVVEPSRSTKINATSTPSPADWLREMRSILDSRLHVTGAILFRNVLSDKFGFHDVTSQLGYPPINSYAGGAALREEVGADGTKAETDDETAPASKGPQHQAVSAPAAAAVFTASDELPVVILEPHQEASYMPSYPQKFFLYCSVPAVEGGESCVTDMRAVTADLLAEKPELMEKLKRKKVRYIFRMGADSAAYYNWPKQLGNGTADKEAVEKMLHERYVNRDLRTNWSDNATGRGLVKELLSSSSSDNSTSRGKSLPLPELEFSYTNEAFVEHPTTGEILFFNQAAVCHSSYFSYHPDWKPVTKSATVPGGKNHEDKTRDHDVPRWIRISENNTAQYAPFDTCFGDGEPFSEDDVSSIRRTVWKHTIALKAEKHDLLVLDNLLAAHGRFGWDGDKFERKLQVSLMEPGMWGRSENNSATTEVEEGAGEPFKEVAPNKLTAEAASTQEINLPSSSTSPFGIFPAPANADSPALLPSLLHQLPDFNGLLVFRNAGSVFAKNLQEAILAAAADDENGTRGSSASDPPSSVLLAKELFGLDRASTTKCIFIEDVDNCKSASAPFELVAKPTSSTSTASCPDSTTSDVLFEDAAKKTTPPSLVLHPLHGRMSVTSAALADATGLVLKPKNAPATTMLKQGSSFSADNAKIKLQPNDVILVDRLLADIEELPGAAIVVGGGSSSTAPARHQGSDAYDSASRTTMTAPVQLSWSESRADLWSSAEKFTTHVTEHFHPKNPFNYVQPFSLLSSLEKDIELKRDMARAHRLLNHFELDELVWNHVSGRSFARKNRFFISNGDKTFEQMCEQDMVLESNGSNQTGQVIHGAVYMARPDVNAIVHAHSPAVVACCCLKNGLEILDQRGGGHLHRIVYYDWNGISDSLEKECRLFMECVAFEKVNTIMLKHHGALVLGGTVREAFVNYFYLERLCENWLKVNASNLEIERPKAEVAQESAAFFDLPQYKAGNKEWAPLAAMVHRNLGGIQF